MKFLELLAPDKTELSEFVLKEFAKHKYDFKKDDLNKIVRGHQVYFQNKPVGFLPFQIHKKGKIQLYLNKEAPFSLTKKDILFEDKWLIIINKPSGLPSQASLKFLQDHAYGATMVYLRNKKFQTSPYLALSHRLDMDTSGVLMMVKKTSANKGVADLFASRKIKKTYLAVTSSIDLNKKPHQNFSVKNYLERAGKDFRFKSSKEEKPNNKKAKYAETKFELLKSNEGMHLFKVSPKTGRSHQIRVHLSESGLPILGDQFYKGMQNKKLHLHAASLEFKHPMTDELTVINSPLPDHWEKDLRP